MFQNLNVCSKFEKIEIKIKDAVVGDGSFNLIAGPCVIESYEQLDVVAKTIKENNGKFLRGGTYKLRTSPYTFQGLGLEGLKLLNKIGKKYDLITVSEIPSINHIDEFNKYVDVIQVGMRNMSNYELLKELGKLKKPILLKRGGAATLEEFLLAAEYIYNNGNHNIILCERGIRTFEPKTRNTLDIAGALLLKKYSKLPVIIDPSHGTGIPFLIKPFVEIANFIKLDGAMIEVTNDINCAKCDKEQALNLEDYKEIVRLI